MPKKLRSKVDEYVRPYDSVFSEVNGCFAESPEVHSKKYDLTHVGIKKEEDVPPAFSLDIAFQAELDETESIETFKCIPAAYDVAFKYPHNRYSQYMKEDYPQKKHSILAFKKIQKELEDEKERRQDLVKSYKKLLDKDFAKSILKVKDICRKFDLEMNVLPDPEQQV